MAAPPPALFHGLQKPRPSLRDIERSQSYKTGIVHRKPYVSGFAGPTSSPLMESSYPFASSVSRLFSNSAVKMPIRSSLGRMRRNRRRKRFGRQRRRRITTLWPRTKLIKVRMATATTITAAAGGASAGTYIIKANSLNDPFGTGGDSIGYGIDQWSNFYEKYTVVASKCWVRVHASAVTGSVSFGVALKDNNTAKTVDLDYIEGPLSRTKMLSPDVDHTAVGISFKGKRFFRVRKWMDVADDYGASLGGTAGAPAPADPSNVAYYHLYGQDVSRADGATFDVIVTLEYVILLHDPREVTDRSTV